MWLLAANETSLSKGMGAERRKSTREENEQKEERPARINKHIHSRTQTRLPLHDKTWDPGDRCLIGWAGSGEGRSSQLLLLLTSERKVPAMAGAKEKSNVRHL